MSSCGASPDYFFNLKFQCKNKKIIKTQPRTQTVVNVFVNLMLKMFNGKVFKPIYKNIKKRGFTFENTLS